MSEFTGKAVLITGGTRGIGRACAESFAQAGARVAICGRNAGTIEETAKEIGGETRGFQADISDPASVDALVKDVSEAFGTISILVNNAGITRDGLLMRMRDEDWLTVLDTNLNGLFYCCRAAVRGMMKQRWGRIINISSIIGLHGQAGQSNYAAAKAGVLGLTKALAHELAPRNITVNAIAPGYIATGMTAALDEKLMASVIERIPLHRAGYPEEIAAVVRFLASENSSYMTGAVIPVDGGLGM